jgi:hypothetical protein
LKLSEEQKVSHLKQLMWFVLNVPESRFIGTFYLNFLKEHEEESYNKVRNQLLQAVRENPDRIDIMITAAAALSEPDKTQSAQIAEDFAEVSPDWSMRIRALNGEPMPDVDVKSALENLSFQPNRRSAPLVKASKAIDICREMRWARFLPVRTIWSNELALQKNPNDLILRAELMEAYDSLDQFAINYGGCTPDVAPRLLDHNLWFIQNIPDYYLYSGGCELGLDILRNTLFGLGQQAVILEAVKRQMIAYPDSLPIALALSHYYPLGHEKEAISSLQRVKKLYPKNRELMGRLKHLRSLIDMRNWR